jgi:hypothetical protein
MRVHGHACVSFTELSEKSNPDGQGKKAVESSEIYIKALRFTCLWCWQVFYAPEMREARAVRVFLPSWRVRFVCLCIVTSTSVLQIELTVRTCIGCLLLASVSLASCIGSQHSGRSTLWAFKLSLESLSYAFAKCGGCLFH